MTELYMNISNLTIYTNNITANETQSVPEFPRSFTMTATIFFAAIFLLGLIGNVLVISVVCFNKNMKSSVNMYLLNLCLADILVLTICMPTALADIYTKTAWHFGEVMCKLVPYLENTVAHGSVLTILAISIERYRVVCYPLKGVNENYKKVWKVVAVIWIISAVASLPWISLPHYKNSSYKDGTPFKACRTYLYLPWQKAYIVILTIVFFVLPSSILLGLYCIVCYVLRKSRKETARLGLTNQYKDKKRLKRQVINILTSIVLLFFVCHLPYRVLGILTTFGSGSELKSLGFETYYNILYACRIMFYLNHAVNPIIYNFVSTKFRNALTYMLTGQSRHSFLVSSHNQRQVKENYRYMNNSHQGQSQMLIDVKEVKRKENKDGRNSTGTISPESSSSSARRKRNEFFPMYASIIEDNASKDVDDSPKSSSGENKCELQIKLVDKDVNMCISYRNSNRNGTANNNCCRMV